MKSAAKLSVKIFGDGADKATILELSKNPLIKGFTTNPTLMRQAGVTNYETFAKDILSEVRSLPISFEVFSDDNYAIPDIVGDPPAASMYAQGVKIAGWGDNVYVKIPVTNTLREDSYDLIRTLTHAGVKLNVTAMMTIDQVQSVCRALRGGAPSCISIFAGRIADTGRDPLPYMQMALEIIREVSPHVELIWASPRELLNVFQADAIGCHIITATNDILKKLPLVGKSLGDYSVETVQMFYRDARESGYAL
jgi:transaldolase